MLRVAGYWWIVVSMIHATVGSIIFFNQWVAIAQDGWINAVTPNPLALIFEREAAFWFMFLTPFIFLMGQLCLWSDRQHFALPVSMGGILLATVIVGLFLLPVSGFWLVLPPNLMMMWSAYQAKLKVNPSLK
jgi:Family of unknown function (DUF6463)